MINVASVQLPLWMEYVKAIGAPFVALVAAVLGGGIAFQQWQTARRKLKLDLFDKRFKVYEAAMDVVNEIVNPSPAADNILENLVQKMAGARWLLSVEIVIHLQSLIERAEQRAKLEDDLDNHGIPLEQRRQQIAEYRINKPKFIQVEASKLNNLFAPYLVIKH